MGEPRQASSHEPFLSRGPHGLHPVHLHSRQTNNCEPPDPANTVTDRLNTLLRNGGDGYVLRLCPRQTYFIQAPILFSHPNQEISTQGYPTGEDRAILSVAGPVANGEGHTVAVDATCGTCSGVKLRNIQVDGTRRGAAPTKGGGNIQMGGPNGNQLVEYVRSFDARSWTCLHVAEGGRNCHNVIIQNNDIGPCGSDNFQHWADGISLSCRNSIVRNNMIQGATDGGIVVFGSPGSHIYNNSIWVLNQTLLGGINMVDYDPWDGDFTGTSVRENNIFGGFATDDPDGADLGNHFESAVIKIGIAVGPRSWFGNRYGNNVVKGGEVRGNRISGAFSYGIAVTSAESFTVQGNYAQGNVNFIGGRGENCTDSDHTPTPGPFIYDPSNIRGGSLQDDFVSVQDGDSLTCVLPPNGGDFWPFGLNPSNSSSPFSGSNGSSDDGNNKAPSEEGSGSNAGVVAGVVVSILACGLIAWFVRKWFISRREKASLFNATRRPDYIQGI